MLKKHVLKRLLPLLFSFCCVFSGFLSVNAFAAYSSYPQYNCTVPKLYSYVSVNGATQYHVMGKGDDTNYHLTEGIDWNNRDVFITTYLMNSTETDDKFYFPINTDLFDYYFITTLSCDRIGNDFLIDDFDLGNISNFNNLSFESSNLLTDKKIYKSVYDIGLTDVDGIQSYTCTAKLNLDYVGDFNIGVIKFSNVRGGAKASTRTFSCSVIVTNKGDAQAYNDIISAINDQTTSLGGKLDSIEQSIEDQFSGEPEEEFNIDDVVTEHTEKMGVLSFGSDVMVQFLDMFQSANAGTAELTLPGFNITVQNVEYQVWPDYSFNFNQIDEWVPGLMSIVRLILPAFVWLKVLGYCITVFEKNFLSNNGG